MNAHVVETQPTGREHIAMLTTELLHLPDNERAEFAKLLQGDF